MFLQNWFQLFVYYFEAWFLHSECSITNQQLHCNQYCTFLVKKTRMGPDCQPKDLASTFLSWMLFNFGNFKLNRWKQMRLRDQLDCVGVLLKGEGVAFMDRTDCL